jgi:hypothetical protein
MQILPPVRPEKSIRRLTQALESIAEKMKVVPRQRITWKYKNRPQLYLFLQGELSILRSSDGLLIVTVYEPHLFGIAEMIQPVHAHLLRAEADSTILRVDADKARILFHQQGLWEDAAAVLSYHTGYLFYRDDLVLQQRTYSVIRNHLEEMILLPEDTRKRVSILEYIQERTHLSRSSILNVVSALKKGDYIAFDRGGYLTSMNKLPERF